MSVVTNGLHSGVKFSIMYTNDTADLPGVIIPITRLHTRSTYTDEDTKITRTDSVVRTHDIVITYFLPYLSAMEGTTTENIAHPRKNILPIAPIKYSLSQIRLYC